jgi:hypothetical protein
VYSSIFRKYISFILAFCFEVGPLPPPFALYEATAPAIALAAFSDLPPFLSLPTSFSNDSSNSAVAFLK